MQNSGVLIDRRRNRLPPSKSRFLKPLRCRSAVVSCNMFASRTPTEGDKPNRGNAGIIGDDGTTSFIWDNRWLTSFRSSMVARLGSGRSISELHLMISDCRLPARSPSREGCTVALLAPTTRLSFVIGLISHKPLCCFLDDEMHCPSPSPPPSEFPDSGGCFIASFAGYGPTRKSDCLYERLTMLMMKQLLCCDSPRLPQAR